MSAATPLVEGRSGISSPRTAGGGLAFYVEGSFETPDYEHEGYAEACGRLADLILGHVKSVVRVEVLVDGDGVTAIADEERE